MRVYAIKMYNGRTEAWRRGSRKYKNEGQQRKDMNPLQQNDITAKMQMLSTNITGIRCMPSFISASSTTVDMTDHLMHKKRPERRRNYGYRARLGPEPEWDAEWTWKMIYPRRYLLLCSDGQHRSCRHRPGSTH